MNEVAPTPETDGVIRCDACPVLCRIRPGKLGACDRYGNVDGKLVRTDPLVLLDRSVESGRGAVRFLEGARDWSGELVRQPEAFVTGIDAIVNAQKLVARLYDLAVIERVGPLALEARP